MDQYYGTQAVGVREQQPAALMPVLVHHVAVVEVAHQGLGHIQDRRPDIDGFK